MKQYRILIIAILALLSIGVATAVGMWRIKPWQPETPAVASMTQEATEDYFAKKHADFDKLPEEEQRKVAGAFVKKFKSPKDFVGYMAGKNLFGNFTGQIRVRLLEAFLAQLEEMSFEELMKLAMGSAGEGKDLSETLKGLPKELRDKAFRKFQKAMVDKFYAQPKDVRDSQLRAMALAERMGGGGPKGPPPGLNPDKLKDAIGRSIEEWSPQERAKFGQFMTDWAQAAGR